jgi:hypothetical protein
MKNELRIGNLVDLGNRIAKVTEIYPLACMVADLEQTQDTLESYERVTGITLTEELLLKFGFKYDADNDKLCKSLHIDILSFRASEGHMCLESQGYRTLYKHIKYVHQLQNLYFALTGEELEIKN